MIFGVFPHPAVTVVDIGLADVLVHDLRHYNKPLRQEVSLYTATRVEYHRSVKRKLVDECISECECGWISEAVYECLWASAKIALKPQLPYLSVYVNIYFIIGMLLING